MTSARDLFLDNELRVGGFFELAIQVCPSINNEPIKRYTEFIWNLNNVEGPFDKELNPVNIDIENILHNGILNLDNFAIPFLTFNIREDEPVETGFNWFDICFYTATIEKVFGSEYQTWTEDPKVPIELKRFFHRTVDQLYKIYPFHLAILDFEVSGQYYLNDLKEPLTNTWTSPDFFVGQMNYNKVAAKNKKLVSIVEEINE